MHTQGSEPGPGSAAHSRRSPLCPRTLQPAFSPPLACRHTAVPHGGAASAGTVGPPQLCSHGVPVPPAWVAHECLNSGGRSGAVPSSPYLSRCCRVQPWILPVQPACYLRPPPRAHCPPSSPTLCHHPLATPTAPLTPFPQEHPGSSVPLLPPQEALLGCASPVARAPPACLYLWILHFWSPHQSTLATPQVLSSSLSPGHPVMSDPNGDRSGPLHPKVPEPPTPTPQASASQPPLSPQDPSLQAGWGHAAELSGGGQVQPSPWPGAGGGTSKGMAGQGPLPDSPPGRAVLLLSQ